LVAYGAAPDGNVEAPPDRLAHDLVLKLRNDFFHFQRAPTATLSRERNGDHFIDLLRNGFVMTLAISGAGFAPRRFWVRFPSTARERCRLPLTGPLRFLQLPLQLLVLSAQPFPLLLPSLPLLLQLLSLLLT
jgi:hypothetical protein